jgi:hypothetical protein
MSESEADTQRVLATQGIAEALYRLPYVNLFVASGVVEFTDRQSKVAEALDPYEGYQTRYGRWSVGRELSSTIPAYRFADALVTDLVIRTAYAAWA